MVYHEFAWNFHFHLPPISVSNRVFMLHWPRSTQNIHRIFSFSRISRQFDKCNEIVRITFEMMTFTEISRNNTQSSNTLNSSANTRKTVTNEIRKWNSSNGIKCRWNNQQLRCNCLFGWLNIWVSLLNERHTTEYTNMHEKKKKEKKPIQNGTRSEKENETIVEVQTLTLFISTGDILLYFAMT